MNNRCATQLWRTQCQYESINKGAAAAYATAAHARRCTRSHLSNTCPNTAAGIVAATKSNRSANRVESRRALARNYEEKNTITPAVDAAARYVQAHVAKVSFLSASSLAS